MHRQNGTKLMASIVTAALISTVALPAFGDCGGWTYATNRTSANKTAESRIATNYQNYYETQKLKGVKTGDCKQGSTDCYSYCPSDYSYCPSAGADCSKGGSTCPGSSCDSQDSKEKIETIIISGKETICFDGGGKIIECQKPWQEVWLDKPAKPEQPTKPADPTKPTEPTKPEKPEEPAKPADDFNEYRQQILDLVNAERAKAGLSAVKLLDDVTAAANIRAKEIETVFSHTRPDGTSCFTVLDKAGYRTMGENIAMGHKTPEEVMKGWMNSEGHKKNILTKDFTGLGLGVYKTSSGTMCWVQLFVG